MNEIEAAELSQKLAHKALAVYAKQDGSSVPNPAYAVRYNQAMRTYTVLRWNAPLLVYSITRNVAPSGTTWAVVAREVLEEARPRVYIFVSEDVCFSAA